MLALGAPLDCRTSRKRTMDRNHCDSVLASTLNAMMVVGYSYLLLGDPFHVLTFQLRLLNMMPIHTMERNPINVPTRTLIRPDETKESKIHIVKNEQSTHTTAASATIVRDSMIQFLPIMMETINKRNIPNTIFEYLSVLPCSLLKITTQQPRAHSPLKPAKSTPIQAIEICVAMLAIIWLHTIRLFRMLW